MKSNWLPLHLEMKVNICIQGYKHIINGHSPSYMNNFLVLNLDINDQNSQNNFLELSLASL